MTCQNCNATLEPGAKFCTNCGAPCAAAQSEAQPFAQPQSTAPANEQPVAQAPVQPAAPTFPQPAAQPMNAAPTGAHPYHELSGFLQFLAIMYSYVSPVILALGAIGVLIKLITIGFFSPKIVVNLILTLINSGVTIWFSLRVGKQIRQKEPAFLGTFQQMAVFSAVCSALISFVGKGIGGAISTLIGTALGLFLLNLYFVKSVRVRTYMGTEEYLKQSLFNKNTKAPAPADGSQNSPEA